MISEARTRIEKLEKIGRLYAIDSLVGSTAYYLQRLESFHRLCNEVTGIKHHSQEEIFSSLQYIVDVYQLPAILAGLLGKVELHNDDGS